MKEQVLPGDQKIKVKFCRRDELLNVQSNTPSWKCGFHNNLTCDIYLTPFSTQGQGNYYTDMAGLSVNEFSQLVISRKLLRDHVDHLPAFFLEGFGL